MQRRQSWTSLCTDLDIQLWAEGPALPTTTLALAACSRQGRRRGGWSWALFAFFGQSLAGAIGHIRRSQVMGFGGSTKFAPAIYVLRQFAQWYRGTSPCVQELQRRACAEVTALALLSVTFLAVPCFRLLGPPTALQLLEEMQQLQLQPTWRS